MSVLTGTAGAEEVVVSARVIRANGQVDELGVIAYWHRNPLKRLAWRIRRLFGRA